MSPKQLIRPEYIRRVGADNEPETEKGFAPGRYFDAECPSGTAVGDFVYVTGDKVAGVIQVARAEPKSATKTNVKMPALGVVISKKTSTDCLIHTGPGLVDATVLGVVLIPEQRYFVGFNGRINANMPNPPTGGFSLVQVAGVAVSTDQLLLIPNFQLVRRRD